MFWGKKKNTVFTSKKTILEQLNEPRALPMGRKEFEEWSDRIIAGAMLTATAESQKFTLANLLLHLGPTESHKEDAFFIHSLRKFAVNQIADTMRCDIRDTAKARLDKEEQEKKLKLVEPGEVPTQSGADETKVLANKTV